MLDTLLSFDAEQARRGAFARSDQGLQTVDLARIRGSVGRASALDGRFRYRRGQAPPDRLPRARRLRQLFEAGSVPPLELYRIADDYFVVDGHHRVALAHERGQSDLEAHVIEYLPSCDDPADVVYRERRAFARATGLHDLPATEPGRYLRLLSRVRDYRHELTRAPGDDRAPLWAGMPLAAPEEPPDLRTAARDWQSREYRPVVAALEAERLPASFPGRAAGDLYGYVCDHRWYLSERRGWDVGVDAALADFVQRHRPADRVEPVGLASTGPVAAMPLGQLRGAVAQARAALDALRDRILGAGAAAGRPLAEPELALAEPAAAEAGALKRLALVAHDDRKADLLEWAAFNREVLARHELFATGTTGRLLEERLDLRVTKLKSGPLGGDQQIGAMIAESGLDCLVFFWDPLRPQPHDSDVRALLRIAALWNVPLACNRASADFLISSPLMSAPYQRLLPAPAA